MLFQAFGAMLFQPHALPGLLVFAGRFATVSPLTCLAASLSVFVGAYTMSLLGFPARAGGNHVVRGFNFLLCGIALGSGYFVVSLASLALALAGAFLCALVSIAIACALRYFGLPPSALPYNLVVLVMVHAPSSNGALPAGCSSPLLPVHCPNPRRGFSCSMRAGFPTWRRRRSFRHSRAAAQSRRRSMES